MTVDTDRGRAALLADHTPDTRNRYVDFLRVFSLGVVVIGHWLMAGIWIDEGTVTGRNVLELMPALVYGTWLLQVMPLFFIVGGYANAASWRSAQRKGKPYAEWLRGRMARLLRPTLVFVAVWSALAVLIAETGAVPEDVLSGTAQLVATPLWFLAVYMMVIPAAPPMLRLHDRYRGAVFVALAACAVGIDLLARVADVSLAGWVNFLFVWLAIHQLGFFWQEGAVYRQRAPWLMAATGLGALVVLTVVFDVYSHSMLGVGDEGNNAPPTAMLIGLALWQLGLALLVEKPVQAWLERRRVWIAVITANGMAMTVYLWHQTALILAVVLALLSGVGLRRSLLSGSWWASRPLWIAVLMVLLLPLLYLFLRVERMPVQPRPGGRSWVAVLGALAAAAGITGLVLQGFLPGSGPGGVAAIPLMLLGGGAMLLLRAPG